MRHDQEHRLQCACVRWFSLQYPQLQGLLFAVPNGGARDQVTGARLKAEGVVAGVADLILLHSNDTYCALAIEMKTPKGRQSPSQKDWQLRFEGNGGKYVICRTLEEFINTIKDYLS